MARDQDLMALVDTTVWIDFLANRPEFHVGVLEELIQENQDLCI
jgi:predicted nucleic acid-binding protein